MGGQDPLGRVRLDRGQAGDGVLTDRKAAADAVERVVREEWGRVTATLVRDLRDLELAEDAVQDAVAKAFERWPREGVPERPGAWITTVARRGAVDALRRDSTRTDAHDAHDAHGPSR